MPVHQTSFFWTHFYAFLTVVAGLLLVAATVALVCKWIERGDFVAVLLEVVVIVMIGVELKEGHDQGEVLDALNASASATARTLQSLQDTQQASAVTLGHINDSMSQQAQTTESMNRVLQRQLAILSAEQKARLDQAQLHPKLLVMLFRNAANSKLEYLFPNSATPVSYSRTPQPPNSPWRNRVLSNDGACNEDSGDSAVG